MYWDTIGGPSSCSAKHLPTKCVDQAPPEEKGATASTCHPPSTRLAVPLGVPVYVAPNWPSAKTARCTDSGKNDAT